MAIFRETSEAEVARNLRRAAEQQPLGSDERALLDGVSLPSRVTGPVASTSVTRDVSRTVRPDINSRSLVSPLQWHHRRFSSVWAYMLVTGVLARKLGYAPHR